MRQAQEGPETLGVPSPAERHRAPPAQAATRVRDPAEPRYVSVEGSEDSVADPLTITRATMNAMTLAPSMKANTAE